MKAGDIVTVKVVEVDKERRRIGLSMRLTEEKAPVVQKKIAKQQPQSAKKAQSQAVKKKETDKKSEQNKKPFSAKKTVFNTAMADALAKLKQRGS